MNCEQVMERLKLFNTETRQKEEILPGDGKTLRLYTCGPTVYHYAHIGNFRTYVAEDLLRRTLLALGYRVEQAMNLTDVDDKTIKGALEQGVSLDAFTAGYKQAFFEDKEALHIQRVEHYPAATDYIPEMIRLIQVLLDKKVAYHGADGNIYFSLAHFPSYGRLAHLEKQQLKKGASGNPVDEYDKENISDFALWKKYEPTRDGTIFWESPFGPGRPGWHIECSAMAMKLLGKTIDIHAGGVDNMFPHHENEIAQSEACTCTRFVRHWMHVEHLLVDHKKMSKSLGNFYTLRDLFTRGYTGVQVRYLLLQTHYRTQLNFTFAGLDAAANTLQRLADFIVRLRALCSKERQTHKSTLLPLLEEAKRQFYSYLADDLNISAALAALFDFVREVNTLCDQDEIGLIEAEDILDFLTKIDEVLAVLPLAPLEETLPEDLLEILSQREQARSERNWKRADECRLFIQSRGYLIEDTPEGARLKKATVKREN